MLVYDLEVGAYNYLVGIFDGKTYYQYDNTEIDTIHKFYDEHAEDVWVGWNSANYDSILFKLILLDCSPESIFEKSNKIIGKFNSIDGNIAKKNIKNAYKLWDFKLYDLDLMNVLKSLNSLKELEGYLGTSINETTVDFELDRPWTKQELEEMKEYNRYDLRATWTYLMLCLDTVKSKLILIRDYNLPKRCISMTNAQLTAEILEARYMDFTDGLDTYDPSVAPIDIKKYKDCMTFFTSMPKMDESAKRDVMIANCPHTIACGGLHGALPSYFYEGLMWMVDVASYYPNMLINFNLTPRSQGNRNAYEELVKRRLSFKKLIKECKAKGDTEGAKHAKSMSNALKLPINTVSGCMKAKFSKLFDQKHNNYMCVTGQLLLIDLIEHLEPYMTLIQSNTDGILIIPHNPEACDREIKHWEEKTGLFLEKTIATKVYQKDVNNYAMLTDDGSIKVKGSYVGQYYNDKGGEFNYKRNIEILDKAIVDFLMFNVPVEDTIKAPNPLLKYQIIKKLGGMYKDPCLEIVGSEKTYLKPIPNRCNRIFATNKLQYGKVKKRKDSKETWDNIEGLPEHCMIYNDSVLELDNSVEWLDLDWYINTAKSKIVDYILTASEKTRGKKKDLNVDWDNVLIKLGRK